MPRAFFFRPFRCVWPCRSPPRWRVRACGGRLGFFMHSFMVRRCPHPNPGPCCACWRRNAKLLEDNSLCLHHAGGAGVVAHPLDDSIRTALSMYAWRAPACLVLVVPTLTMPLGDSRHAGCVGATRVRAAEPADGRRSRSSCAHTQSMCVRRSCTGRPLRRPSSTSCPASSGAGLGGHRHVSSGRFCVGRAREMLARC